MIIAHNTKYTEEIQKKVELAKIIRALFFVIIGIFLEKVVKAEFITFDKYDDLEKLRETKQGIEAYISLENLVIIMKWVGYLRFLSFFVAFIIDVRASKLFVVFITLTHFIQSLVTLEDTIELHEIRQN